MKFKKKNVEKTDNVLSLDVTENSKNKFRFLGLIVLVFLLVTVSIGFANYDSKKDKIAAPKKIKAAAGNCARRITFVFDRSTSIGGSSNGGNNINAIKYATEITLQYLYDTNGPFESDLIAFGTVGMRINSGGWFNNSDQNHVNLQRAAAYYTPYKSVAYTSYKDGDGNGQLDQIPNTLNSNLYAEWPYDYDYNSEGLTNWDDALELVSREAVGYPSVGVPGRGYPDTVIFFTDGDPTTYNGDPDNINGSFTNNTADNTSAADLLSGVDEANKLRANGVDVIPVGIGTGVQTARLSLLGNGKYYHSNNYSDLLSFLQQIAAQVQSGCVVADSRLGLIATDSETGDVLNGVRFNYTGSPFGGPQFTVANNTFDYKTAKPSGNWGFNTSYDAGTLPANYVFDGAYCRQGAWDINSPEVGGQTANGINAGGIPKETTVRCEYKFHDGRPVVVKPTLTLTKVSQPTIVYEDQTGQCVYVNVKNNSASYSVNNIRVSSVNYTVSPGFNLGPNGDQTICMDVYVPFGTHPSGTIDGTFTAAGEFELPGGTRFAPGTPLSSPAPPTIIITSNTVPVAVPVGLIKLPV